MTRVRGERFTTVLDGCGASPAQDVNCPLGFGGRDLYQWFTSTRTVLRTQGTGGGTTGIDNDFAHRREFTRRELRVMGYECVQYAPSEKATHVVLRRHTQ